MEIVPKDESPTMLGSVKACTRMTLHPTQINRSIAESRDISCNLFVSVKWVQEIDWPGVSSLRCRRGNFVQNPGSPKETEGNSTMECVEFFSARSIPWTRNVKIEEILSLHQQMSKNAKKQTG